MTREVKIGNRLVGDGHPAYIIAEAGINHNGDIENAKQLIEAAKHAGVDAVKFQKRTPELCVPPEQRNQMRETPWGYITYMEYRQKTEFGKAEYDEIKRYCREIGIDWFVSVWDEEAVNFMEQYNPLCYKIPSASLTDHKLLQHLRKTGRPLILVHRYVHHGADQESRGSNWAGKPGAHPCHQHLSMRPARIEFAHDRYLTQDIYLPDRVFRA